MNAHLAELAAQHGADFRWGAAVENVELGQGMTNTVHFSDGAPKQLTCHWVLDCSGRRTVLGRQLGITHPVEGLNTASVWNRFEGVEDDPAFWRSFHGIDRRRQTIHFTGPG